MTVLEWLKYDSRYTFSDGELTKIIMDRRLEPSDDVYNNPSITDRERELLSADLIFTAVILSPSSTKSLSQSHNGYQKVVGSETDVFQSKKIDIALGIYKKYDDEKAKILENSVKKIKCIPIIDVD